MLNIGVDFPNFQAPSTLGQFDFYQYLGESWGLLLTHPADFTPVCTTELSRMAQMQTDFVARDVKTVCLSIDAIEDHEGWLGDIKKFSGCKVPFPLVADPNGQIASTLGLLDAGVDKKVTVRGVYIVSPQKKVMAVICYPTSAGRNFNEVLRLIDSLQLTAKRDNVVTPVDWVKGGDLIVKPGCDIVGSTTVELPSGKGYLRYIKDDQ